MQSDPLYLENILFSLKFSLSFLYCNLSLPLPVWRQCDPELLCYPSYPAEHTQSLSPYVALFFFMAFEPI